MTRQHLATTEPPRHLSIISSMAERYSMMPEAFEKTLRATVFPSDGTREEFAAFLLVAKEYDLNPLVREVYAFPKKGGGIQAIVSVDGWSRIINSHPAANGMTFVDNIDQEGNLIGITCQMWRKDREHPIEATEYMIECRRNTDPWRQWPRRLLRHKAMVQAARYAYGFAGIVDSDEAERFAKIYPANDRPAPALAESLKAAATPRPPQPGPTPPPPPQPEDEEDDGAALENGIYDTIEERDMDLDPERERLWNAGQEAANGGMAALGKWAATLTREERDKLGADYSAELTRLAKEAHIRDEAAAGGGVT